MKSMKSRKAAAALLARGPIELVGRRAEVILAAGYSLLELKRAGLTLEQGRELGVPIDTERTSGVGANVLLLRQRMASP
jgi:ribosomal protein L13E